MLKEIEKQVSETVDRTDLKLRKLGVKLVSISISCWMIIGSTAIGLTLPAYLVKQVMKLQWTKDAEAGVSKIEPAAREARLTVAPKVYQMKPVQAPKTPNRFKDRQLNLRDDLRSIGNTVSETRNLARKMADLAIR